jgi:TNF receptor-associated protein 1
LIAASGVIKKYSNFVGCPIFVNNTQANTIQPLWMMDPKAVTPQMHDEFYRFVGNSGDRPRFCMHYKTDAPLSIRALLYFPEGKPGRAKNSMAKIIRGTKILFL